MASEKIEQKFREVLTKKFGPVIAGFTMSHLGLSLTSPQGRFIVTDAKNIRVSGDGSKTRRVTAKLTLLLAPDYKREATAQYVLTFNNKRRGREYKAEISND